MKLQNIKNEIINNNEIKQIKLNALSTLKKNIKANLIMGSIPIGIFIFSIYMIRLILSRFITIKNKKELIFIFTSVIVIIVIILLIISLTIHMLNYYNLEQMKNNKIKIRDIYKRIKEINIIKRSIINTILVFFFSVLWILPAYLTNFGVGLLTGYNYIYSFYDSLQGWIIVLKIISYILMIIYIYKIMGYTISKYIIFEKEYINTNSLTIIKKSKQIIKNKRLKIISIYLSFWKVYLLILIINIIGYLFFHNINIYMKLSTIVTIMIYIPLNEYISLTLAGYFKKII